MRRVAVDEDRATEPGVDAGAADLAYQGGMGVVDTHCFGALMAERSRRLLELAGLLAIENGEPVALSGALLAELLAQASQVEDLLDVYGARDNRQWSRFRSLVAALKLFAAFGDRLLHVQQVLRAGQLPLVGQEDCAAATTAALRETRQVLVRAALWIRQQAQRLNLPLSTPPAQHIAALRESLPAGRLPRDRPLRRVSGTAKTVTCLATAYLSLAAESDLLHRVAAIEPGEYTACIPDPVSEDSLRHLEMRFHSLQSLYDTHVASTRIEDRNADLPILRSHISLVLHLLETATLLAHYFERHLNARTGDPSLRRKPVIRPARLLDLLMRYSIAQARLYLDSGHGLCQALLRRYAEVVHIEVPVPAYRGFHVRPSTLIARVARHYGSEVRMELDGESYDASSPMDIFRANEKINAWKRRWLVSAIGDFVLPADAPGAAQVRTLILDIVFKLAEQGKIVIYQQPFQLPEELGNEGLLLEQVTAGIKRLQATGQLDLHTDLRVIFVGDRRVLSDLRALAESNYGEDRFGNNIALPRELAYLRR